jgi:hypothetical protein
MALQPTDAIAVTLQAQEWQMVMAQLAEGPYRVVAPLLASIQTQCMARDPERAGTSDNVVTMPQREDAPPQDISA